MKILAAVVAVVAGYVVTAWRLDAHEQRTEGWIKIDEEGPGE
jgi:hypothetical protein